MKKKSRVAYIQSSIKRRTVSRRERLASGHLHFRLERSRRLRLELADPSVSLSFLPFTPSSLLHHTAHAGRNESMSHNRKQHRKGAPRVNDTSKDDAAAARTLASAAAAPRAKLLILDKFTTLPYELQHHIIELACCPAPLPPPPSSSAYAPPGTGSPPMRLSVRARRDLNPAFSLALASRKLYALVVPLLYSSVWITRPSSLAAFHLALTAKPALGRSVRSLHVGPCEEGPEWEPTHYQQEELISHSFDSESASLDSIASARASIYTSLRDDKEAARRLLPKWCKSDRRWPLDWPDSNGGPSAAVYNALEEAQRVIDINLPRFSYNGKGQRISFPQREVRLGEVQAALDLYLIKMRRWEDERGIEHLQVADSDEDEDEDESSSEGEEQDSGEEQDEKGKRKLRDDDLKYPTLYLTGYPIRPRSTINDKPLNSTELFTLDRADILQHLARRHAPSDRFDHPLLFSRAGLSIVKYDGWKYEPGSRKPYVDSERADTWDEELFSPPCTTPDYALPNTATLGSLLSLLSSVLSHTPNIQNLSLSGFLERAVCGNRPTLAMLKKLRYLSLGPPPNVWWAPLRLAALPDGLQDLRLCGIRLHEEQLEDVIKMLPSLKTFQWSMIHRYSREHRPR